MKRSSSLLVGVDAEVILEEVVMEEKFWSPEGEVHGAVAVLLLGSVGQGAQEQHHHQVDSLFWSLWLGVLELSYAGGLPPSSPRRR